MISGRLAFFLKDRVLSLDHVESLEFCEVLIR